MIEPVVTVWGTDGWISCDGLCRQVRGVLHDENDNKPVAHIGVGQPRIVWEVETSKICDLALRQGCEIQVGDKHYTLVDEKASLHGMTELVLRPAA